MPIYTGKSADGSDALEVGLYISPDETIWSNIPFTPDQWKEEKRRQRHRKVFDHIAKNCRTLRDEYNLIQQRKSVLSKACRNYIISIIENE